MDYEKWRCLWNESKKLKKKSDFCFLFLYFGSLKFEKMRILFTRCFPVIFDDLICIIGDCSLDS